MARVMYHLMFQRKHELNAKNLTGAQHSYTVTDDVTDHL